MRCFINHEMQDKTDLLVIPEPKTAFYPLFKSLQMEEEVTIFDPTETRTNGGCGGDGGEGPSQKDDVVTEVTVKQLT